MLFNSLEFALFFPLVAAAYFLLPHRFRWALLLGASYWFYMAWRPEYAVLLLLSTVVDHSAARGIHRSTTPRGRKRWLLLSVCTNLGILATFKYFNFLNDSVRALFGLAGQPYAVPDLDLLLPMGISFYTFQTMSYTIDVYRGHLEPARHFGRFALYVTFFPQLVAGPIERAPSLLPQFFQRIALDPARIISGLKQMLWGFFKKLVIADRVAPIVDAVYDNPAGQDWLSVALATVLFAVQIYCDFSGYSDIAIGAARVLGFRLMENFRLPYLSGSIAEFWSRWHISLSTWFRDYLYIPLGGNRVSTPRWYLNLMAVFLISGLWHGASWTFVLWGAMHGGYLVLEQALGRSPATAYWRAPRLKPLRVGLSLVLVLLAWVMFRAASIADGWHFLALLLQPSLEMTAVEALMVELKVGYTVVSLVLTALFVLTEPLLDERARGARAFAVPWLAYGFNGLLLALILLFGEFGRVTFIYFQF